MSVASHYVRTIESRILHLNEVALTAAPSKANYAAHERNALIWALHWIGAPAGRDAYERLKGLAASKSRYSCTAKEKE